MTVSFLNESGDTEKWEFAGGSWAVSGFAQVGAVKLSELGIEVLSYFQDDTPNQAKEGDLFYSTKQKIIYKKLSGLNWTTYNAGKVFYYAGYLYYKGSDNSLIELIGLDKFNSIIDPMKLDILEIMNLNQVYDLDKFTLVEEGKFISGQNGNLYSISNYSYSELDVSDIDYIFGKMSGYAAIGYRFLDNNNNVISYGYNNDNQPISETSYYKFIKKPVNANKFQVTYKNDIKSSFKFIIWGNELSKNINNIKENVDNMSEDIGIISSLLIDKADITSLVSIPGGYIAGNNGVEKNGYPDSTLYRYTLPSNANKIILRAVGQAAIGWNIVNIEGTALIWGYTDDEQTYPANGVVKEHIINVPSDGVTFNFSAATKYKDLTKVYAILQKEMYNTDANTMPLAYGKSFLGNVSFQPIPFDGYMHIVEYGQSLSQGSGSYQVITDTVNSECKMLGNDLRGGITSTDLNNLVAIPYGNNLVCGEDSALSLTFILKNLLDRSIPNSTKFLTSSCGTGGYTVEMLSKNCTNGGDGKTITEDENVYHTKFLTAIKNAKIAVGDEKIVCPFIYYMQGETNALTKESNNMGIQANTEAAWTKELYKQRLLQLKNDMQADIMQEYGQSFKPMFFVYQTATGWQNKFTEDIPMAQLELSLENDDIILLPPHYHMPLEHEGTANSAVHLNPNGYRWCGEQYAKAIFETMIKGYRYKPFMPMNYVLSEKELRIDFYVPVPPITIDKTLVEEKQNYGFAFKIGGTYSEDSLNYSGGRSIAPYKIEISGNSIIFKFTDQINNSVFEIAYASPITDVQGNIRDSDEWVSMYNYKDENELQSNAQANNKDKYVSLYGKKYPIYNWLASFYKVFLIE